MPHVAPHKLVAGYVSPVDSYPAQNGCRRSTAAAILKKWAGYETLVQGRVDGFGAGDSKLELIKAKCIPTRYRVYR